ncbi:peptidyl-prolyl cis-trans isomerase D [Bisgaardia hudsonensis]|uniref:Periplasmic chaperone PpiD n=1 Tax=Bisgaardia hudsonensis TaxID=109472 RepID=A0A4R2N2T8_9PAST|nr:peptidylprolyl isomerase [Bisgaardia hudsonensis]QLB12669.1 peptidylprolyl isomerase [Bisgaardia hudsonensis]TCP14213.1 peptidyl-prolyl cis-trans isomerase D [Bisgaardia hudsonensis]
MLMEKIHAASNSIIIKIIFGFIAVSFVLSGVAGYMFTQIDTSVAKVNGEEISQQTFSQQYNNAYQNASQELGSQFAAVADSPEFINSLRMQVLNRLIDEELLRQYTNELKLGISDDQIKQEIVKIPSFQKDGKFDNDLYKQFLQINGISSNTYASYIREALKVSQIQSGIAQSDFLVPSQFQNLENQFFQKRHVRLATLPIEQEIDKQVVSDKEIEDYYNANKNAFSVPELVKVQYLDLTQTVAEKNVKVSDVEIAQYYQDNKPQFITQHLSHIQVATENEAKDIYNRLQKGEEFESLAKLYSIDKLSGKNGGDLNWIVSGMMPATFEQAAVSLSVGEYSQPVKVDNAYHIIKVNEVKTRDLDEVKSEIEQIVRNTLAVNEFYSMEKIANEKAFEHPESLSEAAKAVGVDIQETDYFSRKDLPNALNYANLISTIFDSDISQGGVNSEAINVGTQHSIIVRVLEHKPQGIRSLEDAKTDIITYLKKQKAELMLLSQAKEIADKLTSNSKDSAVNIQFGELETWVYAENKDSLLNQAIFSMVKPINNSVFSVSRDSLGNVVIIELTNVEDQISVSENDLLAFREQLKRVNQLELVSTLSKALREKAKVEINEDFMKDLQE